MHPPTKQEQCLSLSKHFTIPRYSHVNVSVFISNYLWHFISLLRDYNKLDWPPAVGHHMLLISISTCQLGFLTHLLQLVLFGVVPPELVQRKTWTWTWTWTAKTQHFAGKCFW